MSGPIEQIYAEHGKYVYNIAYRMLGNKNDAEDVTHEVFIKLQNTIGSFKGDSSIKTYIYRMAINQSIDYIRKQQSQQSRTEKSVNDLRPEAWKGDDAMLLESLLSTLDPDAKTAIILYEIGGFSQKEISEILRTNTGTIKSRISRGIKKMSETLKKEAKTNALS